MRYRNPHSHTVQLPEHRAENGELYSAVAVGPGEALEWPIPIAGFEPLAPDRPAKKPPANTAEAEAARPSAKTTPAEGAAA
ncbi:hypothetical protein KGQ20_02135 [Catenulispora sp. NF23]|uniref:Uncharacterized protein n=1 Tax=Catenulispora pinistramenti TaxID=2705254 RepID=A0ABS5KKH6_9ACTN|nr:hypothetical protein [Catenulispora pinistramenti]MBS2531564.1 hypothetical protein [Catenulispora pinistramenti]MBS2546186.1 hypothetical protein [Catenulispora pinistramenti]